MSAAAPSSGNGETGVRAIEIRRVLEAVNGIPATDGNRLDVLRNGEEIFPAMLAAIGAAERSIDLLTFVYWSGDIAGEFATELASAARRGVRVRVLLDGVGAKPLDHRLTDQMESGGVDVRFFRPPDPRHPIRATHRTHRKVMVCDETIGFTGGVGIADEWQGDGHTDGGWRDTHVRVQGPAVAGLRAAFLDNWVEVEPGLFDPAVDRFPELPEAGPSRVQVITGTSEPGWNAVSMTVRSLVELAERRVRITTAYFVPDDDLHMRLVRAARRGVEVGLLLPGPHADKRFVQLAGEARYHELLDAGVDICCYRPSMLHAKTMTVDGEVSVVGSANANARSTSLDEEIDLVVFDQGFTTALDADFDVDVTRSEPLDPARWRRRGWTQRVFERGMSLLRPWM